MYIQLFIYGYFRWRFSYTLSVKGAPVRIFCSYCNPDARKHKPVSSSLTASSMISYYLHLQLWHCLFLASVYLSMYTCFTLLDFRYSGYSHTFQHKHMLICYTTYICPPPKHFFVNGLQFYKRMGQVSMDLPYIRFAY